MVLNDYTLYNADSLIFSLVMNLEILNPESASDMTGERGKYYYWQDADTLDFAVSEGVYITDNRYEMRSQMI